MGMHTSVPLAPRMRAGNFPSHNVFLSVAKDLPRNSVYPRSKQILRCAQKDDMGSGCRWEGRGPPRPQTLGDAFLPACHPRAYVVMLVLMRLAMSKAPGWFTRRYSLESAKARLALRAPSGRMTFR